MTDMTVAKTILQQLGHVYSISAHTEDFRGYYHVTSQAIIEEFQRLDLPVPERLTEIRNSGIRYSNEDFDVLSAAMNTLYKIDSRVWERISSQVSK